VTAGPYGAHHHLAGVDSDAGLDSRAALLPRVLAATAETVARRERGMNRALRMVLMRDRRAKEREDAVAGRLDNVPTILMDCIDHQLERGIDDRARLFGIEIAHQLGRALDVGEQCRDRLALALDCRRSVRLLRHDNEFWEPSFQLEASKQLEVNLAASRRPAPIWTGYE
jgi:hypothetical protein